MARPLHPKKSRANGASRPYSRGIPGQPKAYGHRSIQDALAKEGLHVGRKEILRLMTKMALVPGPWKPLPYSILKKASEPKVCAHLLPWDFSPQGLNRVWMSDITYIWTRSGWFYLAIIMDLYSSKVIRWSVSDKRDTGLVIAALMQALVTHNYVRGQCWDNAPTESWFRTLKMETGIAKAYLPGPAEVETVLFDWIET